ARQKLGGERVVLTFPPGLDFIVSFLGCLYGGAVAVPAHLPGSLRGMGRLRLIIEDAEASAVLGPAANLVRLRRWSEEAPYAARVRWLASEEIPGEAGDDWRAPQLGPDSVAFLQYTSGSTSDPK